MMLYLNVMFMFFIWFMMSLFIWTPKFMKTMNMYIWYLMLLLMMYLNICFNKSMYWYQYIYSFYKNLMLNLELSWAFDMLSLNLILLSSLLLMCCVLCYWKMKYKMVYYLTVLNLTLWLLMNMFSCMDLFYFFLFFEMMVMPMYFLIGIWGSSNSKMSASYQLFLYTLLSSIFMLICMFDVLLSKGNLVFDSFLNSYFFEKSQFMIWVLLFMGFSVKMPVVPVHLWLPEAHVEAPTPGSMMLAGMMLKLGSYAMMRFLLSSFLIVCYDFIFFMLMMGLLGFMYSSMVALSQIDMKKMMAYSSVAHMNFTILGLFTKTLMGMGGSYMMMFSHAMTSSALFFGVGVLYDSYKTRLMFYYGGLAELMPLFAFFYFIFILSNFGFPGTFNFIGEFLLMLAFMEYSMVMTSITMTGLIMSLIYSLFLYNKMFYGSMKETFMKYYCDCTRLEFFLLLIFIMLMMMNGMYPYYILDNMFYFIYKLGYYML